MVTPGDACLSAVRSQIKRRDRHDSVPLPERQHRQLYMYERQSRRQWHVTKPSLLAQTQMGFGTITHPGEKG